MHTFHAHYSCTLFMHNFYVFHLLLTALPSRIVACELLHIQTKSNLYKVCFILLTLSGAYVSMSYAHPQTHNFTLFYFYSFFYPHPRPPRRSSLSPPCPLSTLVISITLPRCVTSPLCSVYWTPTLLKLIVIQCHYNHSFTCYNRYLFILILCSDNILVMVVLIINSSVRRSTNNTIIIFESPN